MQPFRRSAALLASLPLLALTGCHGKSESNGAQPIDPNAAIATVNGTPLTQQQFLTQVQSYTPDPRIPPAGKAVLANLISTMLVEQYAKDQGVAPTDADVDALYGTFRASQEAQSVKSYDEQLAESGQSPQDLKDFKIRPLLCQVNLINKGKSPITDAQITAFYNQHKANPYTKPDRAHIKRIVLVNPADAKRIYDQIQKGQPFDSFVSQSLDHQFPDGDIPVWVNLDPAMGQQFVPPGMLASIKKATPGTSPASVTPPYAFQSPRGSVYVLVQVLDRKGKEVVPLDEVRPSIRLTLMSQRAQQDPGAQQALNQQLVDYRTKAKITIPDKRYAQLLTQLQAPAPPVTSLAPSGAPSAAPTAPGR